MSWPWIQPSSKQIKVKYDDISTQLIREKANLSRPKDFEGRLKFEVTIVKDFIRFYENRLKDLSGKHLFILFDFSWKNFEDGKLRIKRDNGDLRPMCLNNHYLDLKKWTGRFSSSQSTQVGVSGKISNQLLDDLRLLYRLPAFCRSMASKAHH